MIAALILSIAIHEFGHLIVARLAKMKVTDYFIGFGPKIFSFRWRGINWGVRWILAGGYVKIPGMDLGSDEPPEEGTYAVAPWYLQVAVALAGPATHFIIAFLVLFGAYTFLDIDPYDGAPGIAIVIPATASEAVGLAGGDVAMSVDGVTVASWDALIGQITGETQTVVWARNGNPADTHTIEMTIDDWDGVIVPLSEPARGDGIVGNAIQATSDVKNLFVGTLAIFGDVVTNFRSTLGAAFGLNDPTPYRPTSVIGIADVSNDFGQGYGWFGVALLIATLNVALAIFNLIPLHPLDGGHAMAAIVNRILNKLERPRKIALAFLAKLAIPTLIIFVMLALVGASIDIRLLGS